MPFNFQMQLYCRSYKITKVQQVVHQFRFHKSAPRSTWASCETSSTNLTSHAIAWQISAHSYIAAFFSLLSLIRGGASKYNACAFIIISQHASALCFSLIIAYMHPFPALPSASHTQRGITFVSLGGPRAGSKAPPTRVIEPHPQRFHATIFKIDKSVNTVCRAALQ